MTNSEQALFGSEITLSDGRSFMYYIRPYDFNNVLGQPVATLKEYCFFNSYDCAMQISFCLYKTKEGYWYDVTELKTPLEKSLIRDLKTAIDANELQNDTAGELSIPYQVAPPEPIQSRW